MEQEIQTQQKAKMIPREAGCRVRKEQAYGDPVNS